MTNWPDEVDPTRRDLRMLTDELRAGHRVARNARGEWVLLGHAEVEAAASDPERFSSAVSAHLQVPNGLDGDEHAEARRVLDRYLTSEAIAPFEARFREIARDLVASLPAETDAVRDLGAVFAVRAQSAWLGWPAALEPRLLDWMQDNHAATRSGERARMARVADDFDDLIREVLEPKPPEPGPRDKDQVNLTDDESRIMPVPGGGFDQCYNAQAGVDVDSMLIVSQHLSQHPNDKLEIVPALAALTALPEALGTVDGVLADAGYFSQANVEHCEQAAVLPYISPKRDAHNQRLQERMLEPEPLPADANAMAQMKHRLQTAEGRALYARRKCTVEPVFGIIKAVMGFRQFLLRGVASVRGEWNLVCMAWNLKRLHTLRA